MQEQVSMGQVLEPHRRLSVQRLLTETDVRLVSCCMWQNQRPWALAWRRVSDSFLLFPTRGAIRVTLADKFFDVGTSEALLLPDGVRHQLKIAPGHKVLHQVALHAYITDASELPLLSRLEDPVVQLPQGTDWHTQLQHLACLAEFDPEPAQRRASLLVRSLLVALAESGLPLHWPEQGMDPRVATALHTVHTDYGRDLSVDGLATQVGLSDVQFRFLFTQATGTTPRRYLVRYRLNQAAHMLTTTRASVQDIAHRVGYQSDHYFHLSFKRRYGSTPTTYRRANRAGRAV